MIPTIVLVGRPNVGKSTLFNRLTRSRDALVADLPGLTRDRHYGRGIGASRPYLVVDTGGFEPAADTGILKAMAKQTLLAIDEADVIVFLVDGRQGVSPQDHVIADRDAFLAEVRAKFEATGSCYIVVSEGARYADGTYLSYGLNAAITYQLSDGWALGGFAGMSNNKTEMNLNAGSVDIDTAFGGVYARTLLEAEAAGDLLIGLHLAAQIAPEPVLVQLLSGHHVPQAAAVGAEFVA